MAGILILSDDLAPSVRPHLRFATARLRSDPNGEQYVAGLTTFAATPVAADQQQLALEDAVTDALANPTAADATLDARVDAT